MKTRRSGKIGLSFTLGLVAILSLTVNTTVAFDIDFIKNPFLDMVYCLEEKLGYRHLPSKPHNSNNHSPKKTIVTKADDSFMTNDEKTDTIFSD